MDFAYLLRILARRKWLILSAMAAAAMATFVLIGLRPEQYRSSVIMATGIVNYKGIKSDNSDAFVQQYQVQNAFSNLIEIVLSRSSMKILCMEMLRHDLSASGNATEQPFRQANPKLSSFTNAERDTLLQALNKIDLKTIYDPSFSQQFDYLLDKVARAYGYDHDALRRALSVKRKGETDYLSMEVVTENPALSKYMANAFASRFLDYYFNMSQREKRKNVETLSALANEKKAVVDSIVNEKYDYLRAKGLPALGKQSEELVGQITKLEIERQRVQARKNAAAESVSRIKKYEDSRESRDARDVQSRVLERDNTVEQMDRIRELTRRSLETKGKDPDVEAELAEAKAELNSKILSTSRNQGKSNNNDEVRRTREDLYKERVSSDLDRIDAEESYNRLNSEIWSLKNKLGSMVVSDEVITRLIEAEGRALEDFENTDKQRMDANLALQNAENPLSVVENAQFPEWPEPNRQVLISLFAAIAVGTLTTIAIFVLAYMDRSLQSPDLFKKYTDKLPLLGAISAVPVKNLDFQAVFSANGSAQQPGGLTVFREGLRKIRSQLLQSDDRAYLFVSNKEREGKTFAMHALAHSLAANQKKVLMIDVNFKHPLPEALTQQPSPNSADLNRAIKNNGLEKVFLAKQPSEDLRKPQSVDILGNVGLAKSPAEVLDPVRFQQFLMELGNRYDYIFLECAALNTHSDAHELTQYVDKVLAVFNARSTVTGTDAESLAFLRGLGNRFGGALLTEVDARNMN